MKILVSLVIVIATAAIAFYLFFSKDAPFGKLVHGETNLSALISGTRPTGTGKCPNPACVNGYVDCPGPCLKLSVGHWEHLDIPGHDPSLLWQKFQAGDGTWKAWSTHHIGEVIQMQNGVPVDIGKCPICGGTGKVPCPVCKGTGTVNGASFASNSGSAKAAAMPELVKLKDGKTVVGTIVATDDNVTWVRTAGGTIVQVPSAKIVSHHAPPQ